MNILITGCNGQLGTEMRKLSTEHSAHTYFFTDVQELDITDANAVRHFVASNHINLIVNCAAYTNVDRAEEDEATALKINADAVRNLGAACNKVIHISTDYVFSGDEHLPCKESDAVAPRTAYGRTKLAGEKALLEVCPEAIIFRTAWLYSPYGNNFVKTMLRLGKEHDTLRVVYDQIGTPTYAEDLARAIYTAIECDTWHAGIYHFTDEGVCSWFDFTVEIMRQAGLKTQVLPILSGEYAYKTPRPHYSVLDKAKIKNTFGIRIPYWTESLGKCLGEMVGEFRV